MGQTDSDQSVGGRKIMVRRREGTSQRICMNDMNDPGLTVGT